MLVGFCSISILFKMFTIEYLCCYLDLLGACSKGFPTKQKSIKLGNSKGMCMFISLLCNEMNWLSIIFYFSLLVRFSWKFFMFFCTECRRDHQIPLPERRRSLLRNMRAKTLRNLKTRKLFKR